MGTTDPEDAIPGREQDHPQSIWERRFSRRRFLQGAAVAASTAALSTIPGSGAIAALIPNQKTAPWAPGRVHNLLPAGYLHTRGADIVGSNGAVVRFAGVNWFGFESEAFVAGGLDVRTLDQICASIVELGFNMIRLPFSVEMVERNPRITRFVGAQPGLAGMRALEIMDALVASAGKHGLKVVLDNHRSNAGWSAQGDGLWYTSGYSERAWLDSWLTLVRRYRGNDTVIGCDLRNEPATPPDNLGDYFRDGGSLWGYNGWFPFTGKPRDWAAAAERCGNALLAINPRLLMCVEGVAWDPAGPDVGPIPIPYWAGGNLTGVGKAGGGRTRPRPIRFHVPNQLVYAPHDYGPEMSHWAPWLSTNGSASIRSSCRAVWDSSWGYIAKEGIAPVWLGEFGTSNRYRKSSPEYFANVNPHNVQGCWFSYLVEYLEEIGASWSIWALNGTNSLNPHSRPSEPQSYGVLAPDWKTAASIPMMAKLSTIQGPPHRQKAGPPLRFPAFLEQSPARALSRFLLG